MCRSDRDIDNRTSLCQRSWAAKLPAEKARAFDLIGIRPTSSNLSFLRLDGCNPHGYWFRQPPNLANQNVSRTHVRVRVYARRKFCALCFQKISKTGWVGWEVGRVNADAALRRPTSRPTALGGWTDE